MILQRLLPFLLALITVAAHGQTAAFSEAGDTDVYTTSFVIDDRKPIVYVFHEEDGAWQFHSNDEVENWEDVALLVTLEEILAIDPSVAEVAHMPPGHYAMRNGRKGPWSIHKEDEE